jgi:hypothetical protein
MPDRITVKDDELRRQIRNKKRKNFKKDFFELLKRASKTKTN